VPNKLAVSHLLNHFPDTGTVQDKKHSYINFGVQ
jgi:hypothetical protein